MPRIDPLRLLSTLKPLLNPETGGIKSEKEVDKIFVLMTKYSKKLVSKCTYLNIIGATSTDVRDVFMDRGGWDMLNTWTVEAKNTKNHVLLNEIIKLLLTTPASVSRLRVNSLPKEIKFISNKWDNEGTKILAEKLVAHWIAVAKKEEQGGSQLVAPGCAVSSQEQTFNNASVITGGSVPTTIADTSATAASSAFVMQGLGQMTDESLNATLLTDNTIYDSEVQPTMDLDVDCINNYDLSEIMDFNPDLFTKAIDELNNATNNVAAALSTATNEHAQIVTENAHVSVPPQQQQQQQAIVVEKMDTIPSSEAPTVPPILIKKNSGGQCAVITAEQPADQPKGQERFCIINHNGQRLLMRVQVADSNNTVSTPVQQLQQQSNATQDQQVTSTVVVVDSSSPPSTVASSASPSPEKKKRPRKDPSIAAMRNDNKAPSEQPRILKTYSKKTNAELEKKVTEGGIPEKDTKSTTKSTTSESSSTKSSSSSSKSSSSSSSKSRSSSSKSSKSSASSAAAKAAEEAAAEKLRLKVKEQKKKLKEREEAKKKEESKQKQKDDQTLKEIYGSSTATAPSSVKIPKKPSKPSFTDLIGVPGSTDDGKKEKITKEKTSKGATDVKDESKDSVTDEDSLQDVTGFGAFTRSESKEIGPSKEGKRNTTVRVYQTAKSKSMDLLETMTKGSVVNTKGKNKVELDSKDSAKAEGGNTKPEKQQNSLSFEDALAGASAAIKPAKRPSLDASSKSGDAKKPKLDDSAAKDSKKEKENKKKEDKKKESRSSSDKKKSGGIQESSLFMDALCATREPAKAKRKRRLSSSTDKEIPTSSNNNGIASIATSPAATTKPATTAAAEEQPVVKPVFNFYRDTLNDDDEEEEKLKVAQAEQVNVRDDEEAAPESTPAEPTEAVDDIKDEPMDDAFAPAEGEGKLKSCLCIHRDRTKPKKGVRFREDDELKEYHFFEMDETERINVTKQPKNFMEMKLMERSEEKLCIRRKLSGTPPPEDKMPWVLTLLHPSSQTAFQEVKSVEKQVQEERERGILETFYFPGAALPDHPSEGDFLYAEVDPNHLARSIPLDDVPVLTKVTDWSVEPWPLPQGIPGRKMPMRSNHVPTPIPANPLVDPTNAFVKAFGGAVQTPPVIPAAANVDFSNPWTQPFANIPVAAVNPNPDPWTAAAAAVTPDVAGFGAFPGVPNPQVNAFAMPFGFPFPGAPQIGAVPPVQIPSGFGSVPPPAGPNQFDQDSNNSGPNRRPPRGDVDYRDMRRHNNERERDGRNRDNNRPGRGGDRDRDRDRGDRDNNRDRRDRDRYDNNRGDRDYRDRRRPGGRRNTMCSFFAKGYCREGNKCSFLHPGVNGPLADDGSNPGNNFSRHNSKSNSPPYSGGNNNSERRRSPPTRDSFNISSNNNHLHNSPTSSSSVTASSSSGSSSGPYNNNASNNNDRHHHPHDDNPGIESPTPETETRHTPPSSPSENHSVGATEHVKVIPTFTEEDWG